VQEFNHEPTAGIATTERLETMLKTSAFAILVMAGEDPQLDQTLRARENVVHEIGLFQGRLGFRRALVLKQESANEFSNLRGLTYVSLPLGRFADALDAKFEIRRAMEREGLLSPQSAATHVSGPDSSRDSALRNDEQATPRSGLDAQENAAMVVRKRKRPKRTV
jgi:hypothetical protein